ncbi:MAG: acyl-CoA thioesterase [Actinomycetota bacterium]|jgi:acyl-CoA thioester hydrolase|nr:acyl-CoA thioesterase [Geodermatophilaceae bacterium]MDQ3481082.1 acyl-CoA thioesterase [Actinomycetota bacterium]
MPRQRVPVPMRWSDQDPFQHVNNSAFLTYLEQARVEIFFSDAKDEGVTTLSEGVVVVRHEIDYKRPVIYSAQPLIVECWISQLRAASYRVDYLVYDGDTLAVTANSLLATYDIQAARPRRITPEERSYLERFLDTEP